MCLYLHTKFQVSSIILASFRQVVILPPAQKQTPKKPTLIRVKVAIENQSGGIPMVIGQVALRHIWCNMY